MDKLLRNFKPREIVLRKGPCEIVVTHARMNNQ